jgi:hypothetical protein
MRFPILVLSLTAALILPLATQAGINSMREPLFGSADAARERADALDARRLAPISYRDATENYQRADSTFERAGSVDTIRRYLSKAEQAYNKSVEAAEIARTALDATLQAREDALASEAYDYAEDDWEKGETNFASAARSLERGSIRSAERYAEKSESAYRSGELMAIKANYLTETKILIEQAEKLKAERYAPTSLNNARLLLQNAENGLNENRYDTDRPRSLATDAKHNALHAIYVSKLERSIRDRKASLESVLLTWEASIGRLGDALDTPVYFDDGETKAIDTLLEELELLKDREAGLAQQLADRDVELAALLQQTDKMQELLGGGNQTIEELEVLLARPVTGSGSQRWRRCSIPPKRMYSARAIRSSSVWLVSTSTAVFPAWKDSICPFWPPSKRPSASFRSPTWWWKVTPTRSGRTSRIRCYPRPGPIRWSGTCWTPCPSLPPISPPRVTGSPDR